MRPSLTTWASPCKVSPKCWKTSEKWAMPSKPNRKHTAAPHYSLKTAGPCSVSHCCVWKYRAAVFGDLTTRKNSAQFPKHPPTTQLHSTFGKIGSQVTDFSTDNATEEKLAISFQPSGSLAQTWGWCVTFNWGDSGGRQKSRKEWSQWIDKQCLLPDGQPEFAEVHTTSFSGQCDVCVLFNSRSLAQDVWSTARMVQFSEHRIRPGQFRKIHFLFLENLVNHATHEKTY